MIHAMLSPHMKECTIISLLGLCYVKITITSLIMATPLVVLSQVHGATMHHILFECISIRLDVIGLIYAEASLSLLCFLVLAIID
jgi:hypothetical protein